MKISTFGFLFLATVSLLLSGCATLLAPSTHPLAIGSNPPSADVYVNGVKRGTTPLELEFKADQSYTIEFKKEGYETVTRVVHSEVNAGWVILDVICGLVPVIVDASTGKWNELDRSFIKADLEESPQN
ncbi:PEGA domain-containing protein [Halocola ammonii]